MNKYDIVYVNNNTLGYFVDTTFKTYNKEEKKSLLYDIQTLIIKKDCNRKLSSLIIGLSMLVIALILFFLLLFDVISIGDAKWFNYTFVCTGLVLAWILLYYLFGFVFYSKLSINIHFKNKKLSQPNSCVTYASSNYYKYVNSYINYVKNTSFSINNDKKKKELVLFGIKQPSSFKNLIFNGSIKCNIPYYYLTIKNQKYIFLPGFIIIVDGKKSMVMEPSDFKITRIEKVFYLYNKEKLLTSFIDNDDFNINFFYFKYDQI